MDALDHRLIMLLRQDSRRTVSELAEQLGVSRATVRTRIDRLESSGEIVGYTVVVSADLTEKAVRGITMIAIEGQALDRVVSTLAGMPEVTSVHTTNGRWDLIAEISTASLAELDAGLRRIRLIPGITGSETNLLLATRAGASRARGSRS
ncbi:Lrp/AsnC family transcriptional regulator [Mesorhizobium sp. ANAO-SY3R2]|uniref:Lrp/AsnC family transcriptional regulator n=1 Tax=Mesorhizobium sp. ANAO-SY3R2 TaxID=3166644 RepID=UPI003672BDFE